jgi:D-3-phosphoglycerate dehydrogenase
MPAVARRTAFQTQQLRQGRWQLLDNVYLRGKVLGLVGAGHIAAAMAQLGAAIGMRVRAWTYHPTAERARELGVEFVEFDELLRTSDVVSLHLKLTEQSRRIIGPRELALMKPGALLVNTARGGLVDTEALAAALHAGHVGGAGVDVFEVEPIGADHPLLACAQVVLTPHSADQMPEGMELLNGGVVDNVIAFLEGRPQNRVV